VCLVIETLDDIFSSRGRLAALVPGYAPRSGQLAYARAIRDAIDDDRSLVVEASTGLGKTIGYLIPLLMSAKRVVVSTGTRTLQEQLFHRDLPLALKASGMHTRVALLKGRSNYLCPRNLRAARATRRPAREMDELVRVQGWARQTRTGDLSELREIPEASPVRRHVTSTDANCSGRACVHFHECPLFLARGRASQAQLVVANHHLLLLDMKAAPSAKLLPQPDVVLVDEAHQFPLAAAQFLGDTWSGRELRGLVRDIEHASARFGAELRAVKVALQGLIGAARDLERIIRSTNQAVPGDDAIERMDDACSELVEALQTPRHRSDELLRCYQQAVHLSDSFVVLTEDRSAIRWAADERGFDLHRASDDHRSTLGKHVANDPASWIFTSATLSVTLDPAGDFGWFRREIGLTPAELPGLLLDDSFDFERQALLFLPEGLPDPGDDEHTDALVNSVLPLLQANRGRTFFFFTSFRALNRAAMLMRRERELTIIVQGSLPRRELLSRFHRTSGSILLATQGFWEGVDVRGAGLTCVVIDKLPFPSPTDPMTRSAMDTLSAEGENPFDDYLIPRATIGLKQAFGRLIRDESDEGVFVLGDPRVATRSYGAAILASLPVMPQTGQPLVAIERLVSINNRSETRGY
jgi:ATP-dependent DNA helicase DinG